MKTIKNTLLTTFFFTFIGGCDSPDDEMILNLEDQNQNENESFNNELPIGSEKSPVFGCKVETSSTRYCTFSCGDISGSCWASGNGMSCQTFDHSTGESTFDHTDTGGYSCPYG